MLNRLILKVTNFQLPPPKHLGTLAIMPPPPPPSMSNRVNDLKGKKKYWFWGLHVKQGEKQLPLLGLVNGKLTTYPSRNCQIPFGRP